MTVPLGPFLAILILTKIITEEEAEKLRKYLIDKNIPGDYKNVIQQVEEGLGRKLTGNATTRTRTEANRPSTMGRRTKARAMARSKRQRKS